MRRCQTALVATLLAGQGLPAAADVTPAEVWSRLLAYSETSGYEVEATEEETSEGLRLTDVVMTMALAEDDADASGELVVRMDELLFEDRGDGTVGIVFPTAVPVVVTGAERGGETNTARIETMSAGLETIVSGTPEDMVYDYTADSLAVRLAELVVDGAQVSRENASASLRIEDVTGRNAFSGTGDTQEIGQNLQAATLTYDMAFEAPEEEGAGRVELAGQLNGLTIDGSSVLPMGLETGDMPEMLKAGLRGTAEIAYEDGRSEFAFSGPDGEASGQAVSSSGVLSLELSPESLGYEVGASDVAYAATLPDLPFPVTAEMRELKLDLSVPVAQSEEPQPFSIGLALRDLAVSDTIWAMIDPQEALPRDPATLALRLSGTATPYAMLLDPEAMARIEQSGGQAGEINTVEIDELNVSALGAKLTGDGAFTFDNSDTSTFDGMPAPSGSLDLTLSGSEAVIDTLVTMGLIGENDAMGARMMLSMFSVPAPGEDTLTSKIEITDDGHIRANGQRIR
ncbi:hypothetical protein OCH239_11020 [Roseivivax halodurans JCM 10272]|uniref:DUF2125 domain-containing protein n=1 Tax=Roseivivax halodurans JCM 10272 TaxID=1449350 RepID=X7EIE5_9RHOB|nr:DUF2125 domain-containing protein [Roseivivax halodurans]ETX15707.1 hypothetical protein OCH239_11020 [Roseivivax halodurans JCM 10272]